MPAKTNMYMSSIWMCEEVNNYLMGLWKGWVRQNWTNSHYSLNRHQKNLERNKNNQRLFIVFSEDSCTGTFHPTGYFYYVILTFLQVVGLLFLSWTWEGRYDLLKQQYGGSDTMGLLKLGHKNAMHFCLALGRWSLCHPASMLGGSPSSLWRPMLSRTRAPSSHIQLGSSPRPAPTRQRYEQTISKVGPPALI